MSEETGFFPTEENLGKNCEYWDMGYIYPKAEMQGRTSCEGMIDPVCIYLRERRRVVGFDLTQSQVTDLKLTIPGDPQSIPASGTFVR